jgi:hypothetical protein
MFTLLGTQPDSGLAPDHSLQQFATPHNFDGRISSRLRRFRRVIPPGFSLLAGRL